MSRIDKESIETVGGWLLRNVPWVKSTGMTENEDYISDLQINQEQWELKTVYSGHPYKSDKLRNYREESWNDGNFWMVNKTTKRGTYENSKWQKLMDGIYAGLIFFYANEGYLIIYDTDALKDAYLGDIEIYQSHTHLLDDKSKSWETKAMIDTNKGLKLFL